MASPIPIRQNEMWRYFLSYDNADPNNNSEGLDYDSLCPNCVVRQNVIPYRPARPSSPTIIELLAFCRRSHRNMTRGKECDIDTESDKECLKASLDDSMKEKSYSGSRIFANRRELIERRCEDQVSASQELACDMAHQMRDLKISGE